MADKSQPLVSVIVPAYNAESHVGDAIRSALDQTYRPIEVLVADDGSTDGTADIVQQFGHPVCYLHQTNKGAGAARNLALSHAQGEYVAFLDADDVWHPAKLAMQVEVMEEIGGLGILGTGTVAFAPRSSPDWPPADGESSLRPVEQEALVIKNLYTTSSVLARLEAVRSCGGFDEDLLIAQDWDLWLRMDEKLPGMNLAVKLTGYRLNPGISSETGRMLEECRLVLKKAFARDPDLPWHVKARAVSHAHRVAAVQYTGESTRHAALELTMAFLLWPLPGGSTYCKRGRRARMAMRILAEGMGLRNDGEEGSKKSE